MIDLSPSLKIALRRKRKPQSSNRELDVARGTMSKESTLTLCSWPVTIMEDETFVLDTTLSLFC